ncbi:PH domain-containing protein [Bacillus mexicanus]|uniref:PH domain-containing protein n=1 Tax=Bacillus mexicanus TaxID=2834415 RepID=UPI003D1ED195
MRNVDKKSIVIWNLETITSISFKLIIASVVFYFFIEYEFIKKAYYLIVAGGILYLFWDLLLNPFDYKNHKYNLDLDENILHLRKGSLFLKESTVPLKRIQHVDVSQSFFSRFFNLYEINIYTAGDTHTIGYVNKNISYQLKDNITNYLMSAGAEIDD